MEKLKKAVNTTTVILICMAIWVILNENFAWYMFLTGILLGGICLLFIKFFLKINYEERKEFARLGSIPLYIVFLIPLIYKAGFITIIKIITGDIKPGVVEIKTDIKNETQRCLLANAITLTPGTITVDKNKDRLKVLWLDCKSRNCNVAGEQIKGKLEKIFIRDKK